MRLNCKSKNNGIKIRKKDRRKIPLDFGSSENT